MLRIYINHLPYYVVKSTDFAYINNLVSLKDKLGVDFFLPKSLMWGFKENIYAIINKLLRITKFNYKISYKYPKEILGSEFKPDDFDLVYSQAYCPVNTGGVPVFLESGLWKPGQNRAYNTEDEVHFNTFTVPYFKEILQRPCIINLKSDREIENAKELFPEYSDRFVNLPFLLPNLKAISEAQCIEKQLKSDKIKILFVGGEANRKGLPYLLKAYQNLREQNPGLAVELHIVSGFTDGEITIPNDDTIICHGRLPFDKTQKLMEESQIFAMVSNRESYGWVYLEAMSKGCVVIARDYFPQKEFLNNGEIGFLAKPENISSITDALLKAVSLTHEQRSEIALNGLRKFKSDFEISAVLPRYRDLFKSMVNRFKK